MAAYMHGSLAVDEHREQRRNVRVRETRKVVVRKHQVPAREKLFYLVAIMICVIVAGTIIYKQAQIYEVNTNIQHIEKEIERLEMQNKALVLSVRKMQEPNKLYEMGLEMGFVQPADEAIGQISSPNAPLVQEDIGFVYKDQ